MYVHRQFADRIWCFMCKLCFVYVAANHVRVSLPLQCISGVTYLFVIMTHLEDLGGDRQIMLNGSYGKRLKVGGLESFHSG
jgi:hypothetical protein